MMRKPKRLILQWHITERCNWHCKHCYQDKDFIKDEMDLEGLKKILHEYLLLLDKWQLPRGNATINITGGEPLIRKDFFDFAELLGKHSKRFSWGILSNGSLVTEEVAERLKRCGLARYQVSIEGLEEENDRIRGKGAFHKSIEALNILIAAGIFTNVSLTLTRSNKGDVPELVKRLDHMGVNSIGTRRLITIGSGGGMKDELLSPSELRKYFVGLAKIPRKRIRVGMGCESAILNDIRGRELCGVVDGRIIIMMPNGDVYPCRRMPIKLGNIKEKSLFEIYHSNKYLELRNIENCHDFCKACSNFSKCYGGAYCVKYCYDGRIFVPDIQCVRAHKTLDEPKYAEGELPERFVGVG